MNVSIVEDDPVIAKAVATAVREAGHQCTWVPRASIFEVNSVR
jgi:DNA-binding response OmpR family regulator